ncbi:MAG: hypothetical protein ACAI43_17460, partial [Phycisphaerae bacterium]|nr:hypothetical protein [Tepidisphaeraceae bacterium]
MLRHGIVILVAIAFTAPARAERLRYPGLPKVPSVEVVVGEADAVVLGRVRSADFVPAGSTRRFVTLDVERQIAGRAVASPVTFELVIELVSDTRLYAPEPGQEAVVGLAGLDLARTEGGPLPWGRGWVFRDGQPVGATPALNMFGD